MKLKNMKLNMLIYALKGVLTVLFPLLTFPYISRVLQVENVGKYNFANSVISYFALLASLGISTYATREGAKLRNDKTALEIFASEIYTINFLSTIVSYVILLMCIFWTDTLFAYRELLFILSVTLFFRMLGKEWIYLIFEDYSYLTVRYVLFQILSIILLFAFVHTTEDYIIYAILVVISGSGANIVNYFHSKKYCRVRLMISSGLRRHIKPIFTLFAASIAVSVFTNSDTTLLGILGSDYDVGLYSVSVKIYNIMVSVMGAAVTVTIPRMAALSDGMEKSESRLRKTANETLGVLMSTLLPAVTGILILADEIIIIVAGSSYKQAAMSLRILSIALIFCVIGYFWGNAVLIVFQRESTVLKVTILCAIINIALNIFMIPLWKQNAAAFTTLVSQFISALLLAHLGSNYIHTSGMQAIAVKSGIGCIGICMVKFLISPMDLPFIPKVCLIIMGAIITFIGIQIIVRNEVIISVLQAVRAKISPHKKS